MFKFCPVCGSSHWAEHNAKSKHCADCGFTYYANPLSATAAFILRPSSSDSPKGEEMEMLVVRRAKEPAKGTLDLPGGFVDMDETGEQGIIREIQEETGLSVTAVDYLFSIPNHYVYSDMELHTLDMFYCVHVGPDAEAFAADDANGCRCPVSELRTSACTVSVRACDGSSRRCCSNFTVNSLLFQLFSLSLQTTTKNY